MKVLIVSQYFWPENFRINDLVKELTQRGHNVSVLTGIPNYPSGKVFEVFQKNPKKFQNYDGVDVYRVPIIARGKSGFRLFFNYLSFVISASCFGPWKLRKNNFDIIFVYEPSPVTVGLPALLIGKIKRVPVIFWALDLWPETLVAVGALKSPILVSLTEMLVRFIYERCALVLGQSHSFVENISNYCSDASKIRYFPCWAEEAFNESDVLPAPEVPIKKDIFTILFAGNIGEAQDLPSVLYAAELLKKNSSIRWIIVGDGRKYEWLKSEVKYRGLENCFILLGRFPLERMPSFYLHADALLVSLKKDPVFSMTIPGKVQSYLMSGIPIIGMLDGEGAKVINESNSGIVCSAGDSNELVSSVIKISKMSVNKRKKLGLNGREYSKNEFSRVSLINRLELLFKEAYADYNQEKIS